jgi:serine/threonine protein kinase
MTRLTNDAVQRLRDVATWPELPSDRYEIIRPIGRGGMGAVYAARDLMLDREVAVKVSSTLAADGGADNQLRKEARVLAALEHPGIVPVHDAGVLGDGRLFYVMKLVRGETLVDQRPRVEGEAAILGLFERIVEPVAFAHAAGIVHRDLKPSNIMVGSFGEVLVLDWGVGVAGTPGFMAPEQERGESDAVGPASDVFALGAVLKWMLGGQSPPRRLGAIVARCLAPRPADRYADARDLSADLARYRAGQSVRAHRETPLDWLERWFDRYRAAVLLVAAYLAMRLILALWQR